MNITLIILVIITGTAISWLCLAIWLFRNYSKEKLINDIHSIFEGDDIEDKRLSYGRIFTFIFLNPAFILIGFSILKFTEGVSWQIFVGSGLAVVAALLPYTITKASEVIEIIKAVRGVKNG